MQGRILKIAVIILTLTVTASLANAAKNSVAEDKANMFKTKMGCMTCHQGASLEADEPSDPSDAP